MNLNFMVNRILLLEYGILGVDQVVDYFKFEFQMQ